MFAPKLAESPFIQRFWLRNHILDIFTNDVMAWQKFRIETSLFDLRRVMVDSDQTVGSFERDHLP